MFDLAWMLCAWSIEQRCKFKKAGLYFTIGDNDEQVLAHGGIFIIKNKQMAQFT